MHFDVVMANLYEYSPASRSPARRSEEEPHCGRPEHRKYRPANQKETRQCR
jgi:hypothetical protein